MKLYGFPTGAGSPWRVRLAFAFKGIPYEYRAVESAESEEVAKLNPLKLLPVLETDDGVIADSIAILEYLEETYPEKPLLPSSPVKRAVVRQAVNLIASNIQPLQNLRVLGMIEEKLGSNERTEWAQYWIQTGFKALEQLLKQHAGKYCFGDEITLADVVLVPQASNAITYKIDMSAFPTIERVISELRKLPEVQQTVPAGRTI